MTPSAIFAAIAGAIKAVPIIDGWFSQLIAAWMNGQTDQTLSQIEDAAAFAARSATDDDRYKAAAMWQAALKRPRILP